MDKRQPKFLDVVAREGFWLVWVLLAVVMAAFVVDVIAVTSPFLLLVEGALLAIVFILAFVGMYHAAQTDLGAMTERSELAGILGILDDAIIVYEEGFRVIFFNPAAERLFHLRADDVVGHVLSPRDVEAAGWRTLVQVVFPSLAPRVVARSKEGEYPQVADLSFVDPQSEFRVTTAPLANEKGVPFAFMKIVRNQTAFVEAVRSKSEFVTVASHQLRGPVTDITWAIQSLATATELNDTDKMIVQNALAASQGLLRRIEDLLNIAKMEEGEFGYAFEDTDLVAFIGKVLADVLPSAQKAGVKLYFDRPAGDLPHVMIDPKRLPLVLVNLIENAIRYNIENGEVIVKADQVPGRPYVAVSVKDTGIGIPPEDMPKLFNKFYRAENAMKLQTEGSGLGLYIARGIVKAHGGEIWAESELNRGTTMTFTLPTDPNLVPKHEAGGEYLL
ncbi:MAG TPA: ATP-binding protein [Candidatus Paceibacterota bacterium]|nr:ATP-binding protein [Candidatus Paceibacterota bacterium]